MVRSEKFSEKPGTFISKLCRSFCKENENASGSLNFCNYSYQFDQTTSAIITAGHSSKNHPVKYVSEPLPFVSC